ncbi:MAG: hypothetical protein IPH48_16565 [bacterium]|nr:hypothetical protein [bacterium]
MQAIRRFRSVLVPFAAAAALMTAPTATPAAIYQIRAVISESATQWHTFGLHPEALSGLDAFDLPSPPPPPNQGFDAWLVMPDSPAGLPNRWLGDYRPLQGGSIETIDVWEFVVASTDLGTQCRIEIQRVGWPAYGDQLHLLPPTGGSLDMSMGGAYEFPLAAFPVSLWLEMRSGSPVPVEVTGWGSVKALFRR